MTKKFVWEHNGITYTITKSDRKDKKLKGVYINPETNRENSIYFGGVKQNNKPYQHFFDKTGILPEKLNHYDNVRRRRYRERHKPLLKDEPSSSLLSWNLLW